jgi:CheY-like chemotaxis protein
VSTPELRRPAALIADDDDIDRLLLSEAAEQAGFIVEAVANGLDALQCAQSVRGNAGS